MTRSKRFAALRYALLAAIALSLSGCMSLFSSGTALRNGSPIKAEELGDPSTHALVYGFVSVKMPIGFYGPVSLEFAQINQKLDPMFISAASSGNAFWTVPVPVGSVLQTVFYSYSGGQTVFYGYPGLQSGYQGLGARASKPGLLYLGSYKLTSGNGVWDMSGPQQFGFWPVGDDKEIDALKAMLPKYKGSAWEPLIVARMEELGNGK